MIALLGMGLFSQNVITRQQTEIRTSEGGWIRVSRAYDEASLGHTGDTLGDQGPTAAMASYGNLGFAYASNIIAGYSVWPDDDISRYGLAFCDGLNCTYGTYDTLGICPRCADVSKEIVHDSGHYVLRDGALSLDADKGSINITSDTSFSDWDRVGIRSPGPLLVHYLAMVRDNDVQDTEPVAVECAAYWCVVTNYAQMVNGSLIEARSDFYTFASAPDAPHADIVVTTNSSASARTSYGQEEDIYIRPETCRINQTTTSNAEDCSFRVSAQAQLGLQNFLSKGYFGIAPLLSGSRERTGSEDSQGWRTTSLAANAVSFACTDLGPCQASLVESISTSFSNLTAFMSNVIRKSAAADDGPYFSSGTASTTVLIYDLR